MCRMPLETHPAAGPTATETAIGHVHDDKTAPSSEGKAKSPAPTPADASRLNNDYWYELIGEEVAARFLKLTIRYLQAKRSKGGGPRFIRLSARCIRYRRIDLREWAEDRLVSNTSEPDPVAPDAHSSMIGHNSRGALKPGEEASAVLDADHLAEAQPP